ncbi:DUF6338 family protein [Nocardia fluminea]|uniref:Uncharacterized protein n=1 Tax=Nocardia fluminea TaxID=134984 RepID=A0A2N3V9K2_9NOCA|nr:DUF6338 family protein [Nocardia fluminea]PKV78322.1 hypothetical protein ATK86_2686 [Nocardia fluminea]
MAFPTSLTVVFVLFSLVPGWFYLRLVERTRPARKVSGLHEVMQMLAVGLATTGFALLIVVLLPSSWLVDWVALVQDGRAYVLPHLRRVVVSIAVLFVLAILIAYLLYWCRARRSPTGFKPEETTWVSAFNASPKGSSPWLVIEMADGRKIEGWLHSYDPDEEKPDIALQGGLWETGPGRGRVEMSADRFIAAGDQVVSVWVTDRSVEDGEAETADGCMSRIKDWFCSRP